MTYNDDDDDDNDIKIFINVCNINVLLSNSTIFFLPLYFT